MGNRLKTTTTTLTTWQKSANMSNKAPQSPEIRWHMLTVTKELLLFSPFTPE